MIVQSDYIMTIIRLAVIKKVITNAAETLSVLVSGEIISVHLSERNQNWKFVSDIVEPVLSEAVTASGWRC